MGSKLVANLTLYNYNSRPNFIVNRAMLALLSRRGISPIVRHRYATVRHYKRRYNANDLRNIHVLNCCSSIRELAALINLRRCGSCSVG